VVVKFELLEEGLAAHVAEEVPDSRMDATQVTVKVTLFLCRRFKPFFRRRR
jgi:hypothetical protein